MPLSGIAAVALQVVAYPMTGSFDYRPSPERAAEIIGSNSSGIALAALLGGFYSILFLLVFASVVAGAIRDVEGRGSKRERRFHDRIDLASQDAVVRPCHSDIALKSRPSRQDLFVSGGDVGVSAQHSTDSPVQMAGHELLVTGCFGVKIDQNDSRLRADLVQHAAVADTDERHIAHALELDLGGRGVAAAGGARGVAMVDGAVHADDQRSVHAGACTQCGVDLRTRARRHDGAAGASRGRAAEADRRASARRRRRWRR